MTTREIDWPIKGRELHTQLFDSTIWNDFIFSEDDIVISTWSKSGTTWVRQIVAQLLFDGAEALEVAEMSLWLDLRVLPKEVKLTALGAQTNRRFIKTHLRLGALVYSPKAKHRYIGRDGRDVMWSLHNHWVNGNAAINDTPGQVGPRSRSRSAARSGMAARGPSSTKASTADGATS
jgi:aryl sulfotransferase